MKTKFFLSIFLFFTFYLISFSPVSMAADKGSNVCRDCHLQETTVYSGGMHENAGVKCAGCHSDVRMSGLGHQEGLDGVNCGKCHGDAGLEYDAGSHNAASENEDWPRPTCSDCHGEHDTFSIDDPRSPAYKLNMPFKCVECHHEGKHTDAEHKESRKDPLGIYSQSIHGKGLFNKGLIVTASCADCHESHKTLPQSNPDSSISPRNVAETCMKCHKLIEKVHARVIKGELWEKKPGAIPRCNKCHLLHQERKIPAPGEGSDEISDEECLECHAGKDISKIFKGKTVSLTVNKEHISSSAHEMIACVKCHTDVTPGLPRPCVSAGAIECANCHTEFGKEYYASNHGRLFKAGDGEAPYCTTCHGTHNVKPYKDETAPTYRSAIPDLCGRCHKSGGEAPQKEGLPLFKEYADYSGSVHGKALAYKGLLPSAVCTDCHNSHMILKHGESRSSVAQGNIASTCGNCHRGIYKQYLKSAHFSTNESEMKNRPTCKDCHSAHKISDVKGDSFLTQVTKQCGACHEDVSKTYLETLHGKTYKLGYLKAAKCSDCHNPHKTLAVKNPDSQVGTKNILVTCRKCHKNANSNFTGYLTHAAHDDKKKFPVLYYTYWGMTLLLVGTFGFFGLHTLLWLPRSFTLLRERKALEKAMEGKKDIKPGKRKYIQRFELQERITHVFVMVSFISLALTGMMLKFSEMPWAKTISGLFGGYSVTGAVHRIAAVITFGYFFYHLYRVLKNKRKTQKSWKRFLFDKNSMLPNRNDFEEFKAAMKWFVGAGPRPNYGRWTYWEKFDYLAIFWGVPVIGVSGLVMWFPEFFTGVLPGIAINVATIIHSDEALLAVGFIFTVHFFNGHLRPESFPMDTVIFSGVCPEEEYKEIRPREYMELKESGKLKSVIVYEKFSRKWTRVIYAFGAFFLFTGLALVFLIIYTLFFGF